MKTPHEALFGALRPWFGADFLDEVVEAGLSALTEVGALRRIEQTEADLDAVRRGALGKQVAYHDWMLACDSPDCSAHYAAHEDLRGGGELALREARYRARQVGWQWTGAEDLCPKHSKWTPPNAAVDHEDLMQHLDWHFQQAVAARALPDPLFVGLSDDQLRQGADGCAEMSCPYHRRINTELSRRRAVHDV